MKDAEQPKFIHLRCHSEYSVTDGIVKIEEYLNQALEVDMPALALTDLSNLFGAVKFYKKAIDKKSNLLLVVMFGCKMKKIASNLTESSYCANLRKGT